MGGASTVGRPRLGPGELGASLALSLIAAAALFGPHVGAGGRYLDDWWLGAYVRFPDELGFDGGASYLSFYSGARPGAVAYWFVTYKLFGFHDGWHRALSVALSAGLTAVFYLLLRELRLGRFDAAAIAALSLALPVADAIHFWMTPDVAQLCVAAAAGGYLVALRGLRATGARAAWLRAASLMLFAVSALIAETMLPAIALSFLLYRARVGSRRAAVWWLGDLLLAAVAAVHYAVDGPARRMPSATGAAYLHHAGALVDQASTLFSGTLVPSTLSRAWVVLGLVAVAGMVVKAQTVGGRVAGVPAGEVRPWAIAVLVAAVLVVASYAIYVPADASYEPLVPGAGNRVNIGALLPLSVLVFAVVRLIASLFGTTRRAVVVKTVLWAVVLAGAVSRLEADRSLWATAAGHQRAVLGAIHRALPEPPAGSSLLILNAPGVVTRFARVGNRIVNAPVPVFSTWWELDAAVKLSYSRADLAAYPVWSYQPPQVACGAHDVYQLGLDRVRHALEYGHVYVVDAGSARAVRLDDQRQCAAVMTRGTSVRFDLPV